MTPLYQSEALIGATLLFCFFLGFFYYALSSSPSPHQPLTQEPPGWGMCVCVRVRASPHSTQTLKCSTEVVEETGAVMEEEDT